MENITDITREQLNNMPKELLVNMYLHIHGMMKTVTDQNTQLLCQVEALNEKIAVLTQQIYGRKTERTGKPDGDQLMFDFNTMAIINEAEHILSNEGKADEPEMETVMVTRKKRKGKREQDIGNVEVQVDEHVIPDEKLNEVFPRGYDRLPDEVYSDLEYVPAKFVRHEHHVAVYAGKHNEGVLKADRPERLFTNSILTTSLFSGIFNAKYVNAVPISRLSEEFERLDVKISRQVMSGWMIKVTERYLGPVYRRMQEELLKSKLIHCDETPFKVLEGKSASAKSYMWVYHTYDRYGSPPIYLYQYSPGRGTEVIRNFIGDYKGILVTDGYEVYHKLGREKGEELTVAGCWAHAKRKFAEIAKSVKKSASSGMLSREADKRIAAIYHVDNMCKDSSEEERLSNRQKSVKPLVDAYFDWLKGIDTSLIDHSGKLYKAIQYSLNQEEYLRKFLDNAMIPADNNDAERSIRKFCVGKHSWHIVASECGAKASGVLYSIAETSKANGLKPFDYLKYLLDSILEHLDDSPSEYLDELMPWSEKIPEYCRKIEN